MKKLSLVIITLVAVLTLAACGGTNTEWDRTSNIQVYTRDTSSGTRAGFMSGIGFEDGDTNDNLLAPGFVIRDNTGILTTMATDEYGIGYISLASLDDTVKGLNFNGVEPTLANVINNTYELKRPFNYVTRADGDYLSVTEEQIVEAFIAYLHSTDGADIITNNGAIPLSSTQSWDEIASNYPVCQLDNSAITISFGGSDSIQKIAEALSADFAPRCGNFVRAHAHTGSSDGFKRTQGSEKDGTNYKSIGFASRPFKDTEAGEAGTQGQLAWDAIVAIVHLDNELDNVTAADLVAIYDGTFRTWDAVLDQED